MCHVLEPDRLRRALAWIQRRTHHRTVLVVIDGTGSYGAVLTEQLNTARFPIAEAPDIPAHVRRAAGKTDTLDAVEIAGAARGLTPAAATPPPPRRGSHHPCRSSPARETR